MPTPWRRLRTLVARRRGAAYSLSAVLVAPLYVGFVLVVFEVGLLLLAQLGVRYSAHVAARSAAVWHPEESDPRSKERIEQAARSAFAPFAFHTTGSPAMNVPTSDPSREAQEYAAAVEQSAGVRLPTGDLMRQYLSTAGRMTVQVEPAEPAGPHRTFRVTVTYRAPLRMPVVSRLFGRGDRVPEFPLSATVALPAEAAETASGRLGIDYSAVRTNRGDRP